METTVNLINGIAQPATLVSLASRDTSVAAAFDRGTCRLVVNAA